MSESLPFVVEFWHWFVLGLALVILEMLAPGAIFLWMGVAAAVVGMIVWTIPSITLEAQVFWFAVLTVVAVLAWRRYHQANPTETTQPLLNRRGQQYVGRTFTLQEPIINGSGKLQVDDTTWKIVGSDQPAGNRVCVTDVDGVVLVVESAEQ